MRGSIGSPLELALQRVLASLLLAKKLLVVLGDDAHILPELRQSVFLFPLYIGQVQSLLASFVEGFFVGLLLFVEGCGERIPINHT